jgi:hypothetical protein
MELGEILETMTIPAGRETDFQWLRRNLRSLNQFHPHIERALRLINNELTPR